jgi:hypothetical protein
VPIKFGKSGDFEIDYAGAYGGLHVQAPANIIPDTFSPSLNNFQLRNAELRSRPVFTPEFQDPGVPTLGLSSFQDANGTYHTVSWTGPPSNTFWQLQPVSWRQANPNLNPWIAIPDMNPIQSGIPVSYGAFANVIYWCNGNQYLQSWDGFQPYLTNSNDVALISQANFPWAVGTVSIGGYFLSELASHLLMANITANDGTSTVRYQQRLWWSSSGNATVSPALSPWDITTFGTGGGYNDFLECPDVLTGIATVGIQGYLFRTNGITQIVPTGSGTLPFDFDHYWASNRGIGAAYPWSIASYGPNLCFISYEQIYMIGVNSFQAIGGNARDAIMADLYAATGKPICNITSNPRLEYVYFGYQIAIPQASGTKYYFFDLEDQNWLVWFVSGKAQTARYEEVFI